LAMNMSSSGVGPDQRGWESAGRLRGLRWAPWSDQPFWILQQDGLWMRNWRYMLTGSIWGSILVFYRIQKVNRN
jgi:hypothetical protein